MNNILYIGDSPLARTGMGRVAREFGKRLLIDTNKVIFANKTDKRIIFYAWNYNNNDQDLNNTVFDIFPAVSQDHRLDKKDIDAIFVLCLKNNIDTIICQGDVFYFKNIQLLKEKFLAYYLNQGHLRNLLDPEYESSPAYVSQLLFNIKDVYPKLIGYFNIDGEIVDKILYKTICNEFDHIFVSSNFAYKQLLSLNLNKPISVIYHGVDTNVFKKIPEIHVLKSKNKNIVHFGTVMQLSPRKNLTGLLYALSKLKEKKLFDFKVSIICSSSPGMDIQSINALIAAYNLQNNIYIIDQYVEDSQLVEFYNHLDFYITTTLGEGFGLPILEAMACGIPVIGSKNSSLIELIGSERGRLIPCYNKIFAENSSLNISIPDTLEAVNILKSCYNIKSSKTYSDMSNNCIQFAQKYTWDNVVEDFKKTAVSRKDKIILFPGVNSDSKVSSQIISLGKSIAVVKVGGIGDNLQLIPLLKHIRKQYPEHKIDVVVEKDTMVFSIENKKNYFDRVITIPQTSQVEILKNLYNTGNYDYIYDVRYVSRKLDCINNKFEDTEFFNKYKYFYYFWTLSNNQLDKTNMHVVDLMLQSLGITDTTIDDLKYIDPVKLIPPKINQPYILLNFSINIPKTKKIDTIFYTKQLCQAFPNKHFVLTGFGNYLEESISCNNLTNLINKTNFFEYISLINNAEIIITLDSGTMWLSKALDKKKVIVLFNSTPVVNFGFKEFINLTEDKCHPCWWNTLNINICPLGHKYCINTSTPDKIITKMMELQ